jgi:hypothetical protein
LNSALPPTAVSGYRPGRAACKCVDRVAAEAGDARDQLLLAAWDAAPKGGAFSGVAVLVELGPHLAKLPSEVLFEPWAESLRRASRSRRPVLQELEALADVIAALGGRDAVADVVAAVEDVDRWWP